MARISERAALAWTEKLTLIADSHIDDDLFEHVGREFSEAEVVNLTTLVGLVNAWNRLAISMRYQHG